MKIKFRIYDKNEGKYLDSSDYQVSCDDGDIYETVGVGLHSNLSAGIIPTYGLLAERYTSEKDMNSQEIYVGDVLRGVSRITKIAEEYLFRVYQGVDGAFRYEGNYTDEDGKLRYEKWKRSASQTVHSLVSGRTKKYYEVEVIGSIHDEENIL